MKANPFFALGVGIIIGLLLTKISCSGNNENKPVTGTITDNTPQSDANAPKLEVRPEKGATAAIKQVSQKIFVKDSVWAKATYSITTDKGTVLTVTPEPIDTLKTIAVKKHLENEHFKADLNMIVTGRFEGYTFEYELKPQPKMNWRAYLSGGFGYSPLTNKPLFKAGAKVQDAKGVIYGAEYFSDQTIMIGADLPIFTKNK